MTLTHSSANVVLPDLCRDCDLDPCACSYITDLRPDGTLAHLRQLAAACMSEPLPHRPGCPCPPCYSARLGTWVRELAALPGRCRHGYAEEQVFHTCEIRDVS